MTKESWLNQGFEIEQIELSDVMEKHDFTPYYLIVFCMNETNRDQFLNCMRIIQKRTHIPIVMFDIEPQNPEFEARALLEGADRVLFSDTTIMQAIVNCIALIRRYVVDYQYAGGGIAPVMMESSGLLISFDFGSVVVQGQEVELTPREYDLLRAFSEHRGQKLSYLQIYELVWGSDVGFSAKMVSNLVSKLRSKLQVTADTPEFIHSIRGYGYRFTS